MAKSRVPMRVVVRIPPGHLVGSVLVPRRLGTRLNRTQPPIAITRETINVLEGGERRRTPQREGERHFSLSLRAAFPTFFPFSLSLSLSFTATFRSFVLASKSLVYLSYIWLSQFFRRLAVRFLLKKILLSSEKFHHAPRLTYILFFFSKFGVSDAFFPPLSSFRKSSTLLLFLSARLKPVFI